jgi:hypothetical protein
MYLLNSAFRVNILSKPICPCAHEKGPEFAFLSFFPGLRHSGHLLLFLHRLLAFSVFLQLCGTSKNNQLN